MPLHQILQKILLIGANLETPAAPPAPAPPERLRPLIESLAQAHREHDAVAIRFGHRYRSGFWAIYLLSALAVLCAMMPLALGWDDLSDPWHPLAPAWVVAEIVVIASVAIIYWRGHRSAWQGEWLRARTVAEFTTYLPLIAPLVDFSQRAGESWYARVLPAGSHLAAPAAVVALCDREEAAARAALADAWSDPEFAAEYAAWAAGILRNQEAYHLRVARRSHVLQHRIHAVTATLFALTALGALAHLVIHSRWISLITTVFPASAAALHGALAQSESYRLEVASGRVAVELQRAIEAIQLTSRTADVDTAGLKTAVRDAVALILEEHQDWTMLVKPHHLPLG